MTEPLGLRMWRLDLAIGGKRTDTEWRMFLRALTKFLTMTPAGKSATWHYPTGDGLGGNGMTMIQPITESFIALDTWPDHDGAYLLIRSCKSFNFDRVAYWIECQGFHIRSSSSGSLKLTEDMVEDDI